MLRSRANTLLSVRRVTELNAGRKTAGIDGAVALFPEARAELATWVQQCCQPWTARPVKRVLIPKANGKQRPLGIPVGKAGGPPRITGGHGREEDRTGECGEPSLMPRD
jgi:RNA-directed DNA polymerase